MTVSPIAAAFLHQPSSGPTELGSAYPAHGVDAVSDVVPDPATVPGTHASPVTAAEQPQPLPAELVGGNTPGDRIIEGWNKRLNRFRKALEIPPGVETSPMVDREGAGDDLFSIRREPGTWAPVADGDHGSVADAPGGGWSSYDGDEEDYDRHAEAMAGYDGLTGADASEGFRLQRALDEGGRFVTELSKSAQSLESSIKTLVTSQ